ncbi:hypothetical protein F5Y04DRAFT_259889 [Hypomontagnella monticulosa]|nr:hypothetical protein F5Y04DRAFT_259889 [Hypomontagnella monticulosa]
MKATSFFLSTVSLAVAIAAALPADVPAPNSGLPEGYKLVDVTWSGNITADGPEMSFTGSSFHDIDSQILKANPDFVWPDVGTNSTSEVMKRGDLGDTGDLLFCRPNGVQFASSYRIKEGIDYLRGKSGKCHMQAGPRVCTRISCSYKSGIFWCNDNKHDITIDCADWSSYSQDILDKCQTNDNQIAGQEFSTSDKWNILIGRGNC